GTSVWNYGRVRLEYERYEYTRVSVRMTRERNPSPCSCCVMMKHGNFTAVRRVFAKLIDEIYPPVYEQEILLLTMGILVLRFVELPSVITKPLKFVQRDVILSIISVRFSLLRVRSKSINIAPFAPIVLLDS